MSLQGVSSSAPAAGIATVRSMSVSSAVFTIRLPTTNAGSQKRKEWLIKNGKIVVNTLLPVPEMGTQGRTAGMRRRSSTIFSADQPPGQGGVLEEGASDPGGIVKIATAQIRLLKHGCGEVRSTQIRVGELCLF